jgi:hypothetical protein
MSAPTVDERKATMADNPAREARRAELVARLDAAIFPMTVQLDQDGCETYTQTLPKGWLRFDRTVREWAVQTSGDHIDNDDDREALDNLTGGLFDHVRREVVAWCEAQDARRAIVAKGRVA